MSECGLSGSVLKLYFFLFVMASYSTSNASAFPMLSIDSSNVSGSFTAWLEEFRLSVEFKSIEMGTAEGGAARFTDKSKRLVLLKCIGQEGRNILSGEGYKDLSTTDEPTYDRIIELLSDHYRDTESRYVKTQKFVSVRQEVGEDFSSYLRRVDRLSRSIGMFHHETAAINEHSQGIRRELALVLAVNGLRDETLCRELIAKSDLTWKSLGDILRCRATAIDTVEKLHANVKSEPGVTVNSIQDSDRVPGRQRRDRDSVRSKNRDSYSNRHRSSSRDSYYGSDYENRRRSRTNRRDKFSDGQRTSSDWRRRRTSDSGSGRSNSRDRYQVCRHKSGPSGTCGSAKSSSVEEASCYHCGNRGHTIRECSQVRCYMCQRRGHMACDCTASRCVRCDGKPHSVGKRCPGRTPPPSPGGGNRSVRFRDSKSTKNKDDLGSSDCD